MVTKLVIAGHGTNTDGSFDPGAKGIITKGENKYYRENFFPAVRKYLPDNSGVVLFDSYNVYSKGNLVALANSYGKGTEVYEMHYDASGEPSASGGHVIVHKAYEPDKQDLKLRDWIKKHIGVRYNHKGHVGISGRDDLLNCNLAKAGGINYRLVELGFGTNPNDAKTMLDKVDALAKDFVIALVGKVKESKPAPSKPVPSTPVPSKPAPSKPTTPTTSGTYTVKRGDTLWGIANSKGTTVSQLKKNNPTLKSNLIIPGQVLKLSEPVRHYTVKKGDTLSEIGSKLGVSWTSIANKNNIKSPYVIKPGQILKY